MTTVRTRGPALPPSERTCRTRSAARVLVLAAESVLLLRDSDPGCPGSAWYVLPGGGIDPGEQPLEAAIRELGEETGQAPGPDQLQGPIANRRVWHGYSDQVLIQTEQVYLWRAPARFDLDTSGHTLSEREPLTGYGWWPLEDLPRDAPVWPDPAVLAAVLDSPSLWPLALGDVEESTVPLALGYRR